jgi:UDP-4-amino-4,6-dideoxy-N-acetyl-beta-L-altrosamine transaminase
VQIDREVRASSQPSLAIDGGKPVRDTWLPYGHQQISEADIKAVTKALRSDFLTQGPEIRKFENTISKYLGVKHAVAIANGTAALHAAYFAAGIGEGDLIVTAPITFAATSNAAVYLGARPVYADVFATNGLIDPVSAKALLKKYGKKVKAIVGIDFAGQPCDYDALEALSAEYEIPFIVDAAHSLGAIYKGRNACTAGSMATLSFHPVKSITTGEGGMILTNDDKLQEKLATFRSHGIEKHPSKLTRHEGPWYHEMQTLGYNYRMCDIQAALGTSQMTALPAMLKRRREIAKAYTEKLAGSNNYEVANVHTDRESAYHLFPILVKGKPYAETRKKVFEALHAENIGVQVHYIPTYQMPFYQELLADDWAKACPGAEEFYAREIGLPIFPGMTEKDIDDVVTALEKIAATL